MTACKGASQLGGQKGVFGSLQSDCLLHTPIEQVMREGMACCRTASLRKEDMIWVFRMDGAQVIFRVTSIETHRHTDTIDAFPPSHLGDGVRAGLVRLEQRVVWI